ncbi:MAG TPA: SGNH/GDSL hydrolase family protein [Ktedonobacteraceae bacterium]|nr:SGNH/GDSL hydrolase family protein [Ktedonobacteraceae bacterium]
MLKNAHIPRRSILPLTLAISLLFAFVPVALVVTHAESASPHLVGPKQHYLALGDSLAFGYQPNGDFNHGYATDLFQALHSQGVQDFTNYACPSETSTSFISVGCPFAPAGTPAQLTLALAYLQAHAGTVSPVTLDIGASEVLPNIDPTTCAINTTGFDTALDTLNANLRGTILPDLKAALTVSGQPTGDLALMNYYDPYQNICPKTVPFVLRLNAVLTSDARAFGFSIVDVFGAFGGAPTPNPNICTYTWICSSYFDVHPNDQGYSVIASTFAAAIAAN